MRAFLISSMLLLFRNASEKSTTNRSQSTNEQSPMANKDNEKTPNGQIVGLVKGMLAATCVLSFLTILATGLAFLYYSPLM